MITAEHNGTRWVVTLTEGSMMHQTLLAADSAEAAIAEAIPTLRRWARDWSRAKRK